MPIRQTFYICAMLKNIVFDLGGVLTNLDYKLTEQAFKALGMHRFHEMYSQFTANDLFADFERGKISAEDFRNALRDMDSSLSSSAIDDAWNAMLLDFRTDVLPFLQSLAKQYRLFLFSNTNDIHLAAIRQIFTADTGEASIDVYFEKAWYSNLIGHRKPDVSAFEYILADAGIAADDTLFVDDSAHNIEGARAAGLHVYHLQPGQKIQDIPYQLF